MWRWTWQVAAFAWDTDWRLHGQKWSHLFYGRFIWRLRLIQHKNVGLWCLCSPSAFTQTLAWQQTCVSVGGPTLWYGVQPDHRRVRLYGYKIKTDPRDIGSRIFPVPWTSFICPTNGFMSCFHSLKNISNTNGAFEVFEVSQAVFTPKFLLLLAEVGLVWGERGDHTQVWTKTPEKRWSDLWCGFLAKI